MNVEETIKYALFQVKFTKKLEIFERTKGWDDEISNRLRESTLYKPVRHVGDQTGEKQCSNKNTMKKQ